MTRPVRVLVAVAVLVVVVVGYSTVLAASWADDRLGVL